MQATQFIKALYQAVDDKNIEQIAAFLAQEVNFKLANFPATQGKKAVLEANQSFFTSIDSMRHHLEDIWQIGNTLVCHGRVDYLRLDKSKTSATFATILTVEEEKITNYLVFADLSEL